MDLTQTPLLGCIYLPRGWPTIYILISTTGPHSSIVTMEISTLANTLSWVHQRLGSLGPLHFLSIPVIWLACHVIYLRYFHPLHSYPGPCVYSRPAKTPHSGPANISSKVWASITPLYRAWQLSSGRYHILVGECTKLYGPVYRDAPNSLMFNDPNFAEAVHGRQGYKKFPKHRFWWSLKVRADDSDLSTLLSRDSEAHTRLKKGVAGAVGIFFPAM